MKQLFLMIGIRLRLIKIFLKKLSSDKNHACKSYLQNENNFYFTKFSIPMLVYLKNH